MGECVNGPAAYLWTCDNKCASEWQVTKRNVGGYNKLL